MEKKTVATNRKAYHDYEILEKSEAGIVLAGYEVKSIRDGKASLTDGFVQFERNEAYLNNIHIPPYTQQSTHIKDYEPRRKRKLLLHGSEIKRLYAKVREKGLAVVPLDMYFSVKGYAKVTLGLAKGRRAHDKRDAIKKKDAERDMRREQRRR